MADQVTPTGGLAPGLPLPLLVASAPRPVSESTRQAKPADSRPAGSVGGDVAAAQKSPAAAMEQLNGHLEDTGSELRFQVDKSTGHTVFKLIEPNSGKVLLQVPSEEVLAMARNLRAIERQEGTAGVLVNKEG